MVRNYNLKQLQFACGTHISFNRFAIDLQYKHLIDIVLQLQEIGMSANTCSITGQPLLKPVVSRKTGHIYEKQVIQKHLSTFPYCPISNQPMQLSDLIQMASSNVPLVKANESVRSYMANLRNEYDTLILQTHYLRQSLKQTKQQIMHCAYQNQAAQRVIAKLLKQIDETQSQIRALKNEQK